MQVYVNWVYNPTSYNLIDASSNKHNLSTTDCEKDLNWVWLSSTLRPSVQCQKAYAKAMQNLAIIKWSFKSITHEWSFKNITQDLAIQYILYKAYIQPHIEYCIQAWLPYYAKDIDMLEKI